MDVAGASAVTDLKERNISLRNYQTKLIEIAKKQNSIIFLPTGAGKTLIAINVLCSRTKEINKPYREGGKKAFFIASTKVMVFQLASVLRSHTKFSVGHYTGDINLDSWSKETWKEEFESYHVLVLTAEILRRILLLKFISHESISLLVFDECHHAVLNHPYRGIMTSLQDVDISEMPLTLGLSAVLLNSNPRKLNAKKLIMELESTFRAKVITEPEIMDVLCFTARPIEKLIEYGLPVTVELVDEIYDDAIKLLTSIKIKNYEFLESLESLGELRNPKPLSRIKKCFVNSKKHLHELGPFCGSLSALFFIILLEKYRLMSNNPQEIEALVYARTEFHKIRRLLARIMNGKESSEMIYNNSSSKVQKLIDIIIDIFNKPESESVSTIVFVYQRATAIVLEFMMKRLKALDERFHSVNSDFIVGSSQFDVSQYSYLSKNEDIVKRFSLKQLNLLLATNILEEGIDVSACNTVISFDFPLSYSSYIQSRGRIRDKKSVYYVFCNHLTDGKESVINSYRQLEHQIFEVVTSEVRINEDEIYAEDEDEKICLATEVGNIWINGSLAINSVDRYCSRLPQDHFSYLAPILWYIKHSNTKQAILQLPINCPLRDKIMGDKKQNFKMAKKSVYLKTLRLLYESREVNHQLNPREYTIEKDFRELFPHYNEREDECSALGNKRIYKIYTPDCFYQCLPVTGKTIYLHVINFKANFREPILERKIDFYYLLESPRTYGILSSKKLPKICSFPLFVDMGQIDCDILENFREIFLNSLELRAIKLFHYAFFKKVLNIPKDSQILDGRNKENSFFIVPLLSNDEKAFVLDWDVIESDFCKEDATAMVRYNPSLPGEKKDYFYRSPEPHVGFDGDDDNNSESIGSSIALKETGIMWNVETERPSESRPNFIMTEAAFKNFVISPTYRGLDPPQHYIISSFCYNLTPLSPFPREEYQDYFSYYKMKYNMHISNLEQPLLKVCNMPNCSNFNRPRCGTRRSRDKRSGYQELLVPELCYVHPYPNMYWLKALFIPTVLNRMSVICRAEELRKIIVTETGMGVLELGKDEAWRPLVNETNYLYAENVTDCASDQEISDSTIKPELPLSYLSNKVPKKKCKTVFDVERNLYKIGLCDLENLINYVTKTEPEEETVTTNWGSKNIIEPTPFPDFPTPRLHLLSRQSSKFGPQISDIVQACTSKSANDVVNYERLEILGDSFLKFSVSLFLFKGYSEEKEGILTGIKGKLVGNKNLMFCGLAKNLHNFLNVNDFSPLSDWNPPLFSLPDEVVAEILDKDIDPAILSRFSIPRKEQLSGSLSEKTLSEIRQILNEDAVTTNVQSGSAISRQVIKNKTISDVVEALIGTYLLEYGFPGGFRILTWLGVLPEQTGSFREVVEKPYDFRLHASNSADECVMNLLNEVFFSDLETSLGYSFNNKAILLEALTHPSFYRNRLTHCYQRLEFLGDAVLDFLLTVYIYENHRTLTPGQITDIRSSLVNNITFACLSVRWEFHKYLFSISSTLNSHIEAFVKLQTNRNHVVDENVLILLEEDDCLLAESVKVPKALGDVFESIAGAIFIDSGNSLEAVWKVYYKIMKPEIDEFTKNIPKTSVRLLHEISEGKPYYETTVANDIVTVACTVLFKNTEIITHGIGGNKREAKVCASKLALKKILELARNKNLD